MEALPFYLVFVAFLIVFHTWHDRKGIKEQLETIGLKKRRIRWTWFFEYGENFRGFRYYVDFSDKEGKEGTLKCLSSILGGINWLMNDEKTSVLVGSGPKSYCETCNGIYPKHWNECICNKRKNTEPVSP